VAARRTATVLVYRQSEADAFAAHIRAPRDRVKIHVAASPDDAAKVVGEADVVWGWKFPPALYAKAPRLAWLETMGAGVDWALVTELPSRVTVTRAAGIFGPWMAEYTVGWCLWVTQRMDGFRASQRQRRWAPVDPIPLRGQILCVVGLGDIGRSIAKLARGLGMRVIGVTRSGRASRDAARVYRTKALRAALAQADFVALTLPLSDETRGLLDPAALAAMKPTAWLLNLARGPIVDERALLDALRGRRIGGAVLDVFDAEPLPADHPFWGLDNVVVTPHISGPSTPREIGPIFNDNLRRYAANRPLRHLVDRTRGY